MAITRAKENAWLSFANQRYRWGNHDFCTPSRFLEELDEKYIDNQSMLNFSGNPKESSSGMSFHQPTTQKPFTQRQPQSAFKTRESQNIFNKKLVSLKQSSGIQQSFEGDDPAKIQAGMTVEHQRFGEGKVLNIEGNAPDIKATVYFPRAGQKQLLLKFARLKIKG